MLSWPLEQGWLPVLAPCVSHSGQTRFALKQFFHWKIPLQPTSEGLLFPLLFQHHDFLFFPPFTWEIIYMIIGRDFFPQF